MNNKWYLCKNVIKKIPDELKKINQSQYFHLALCIQIWKIWTFSNTFRLKKKRGSLVWPKLKSTKKVEDMLESQTFVAVHPARGPGDWVQPCCFTGETLIKEDWRLELPWPAWIARTPQPHAEACPRGECRAQHLDEELPSCGDLKSHILILPFPSVNLHRKCLYTQNLRWVVKMMV